jgi:hypothetical protein
MKLPYFFGCILAAASLAVWPKIGLAHGVIIKERNKNKLGNRERRRAREVFKEVSTPKIIDFALGRKALERGALDEEQSRARLAERIRLPGRLSGDWLEFLLTMAMFFALLLGLYVGLIGSWRL